MSNLVIKCDINSEDYLEIESVTDESGRIDIEVTRGSTGAYNFVRVSKDDAVKLCKDLYERVYGKKPVVESGGLNWTIFATKITDVDVLNEKFREGYTIHSHLHDGVGGTIIFLQKGDSDASN